ncbi:hypothetical protein HH214_08405 [Mucilaginibacter robiniae]|uniref:Pectate lyase superfamily protein domain-containing protein n=1 Tax=Mucilaginibacter robiniae TaxID=2728022 RepID=A0A7L5E4Y6_9SPHI|nr:glycosyl hydrolase family 28-related protein [Mucilaginibacter robiniae]QJD95893.1 hypothetical protein HH214_08405 [Mucilaginibacter robiniae]
MINLSDYSALRNCTAYTDTIFVQGCAMQGDGGEGLFIWENSSIAPDDGGTILRPAVDHTPSSGAWKRIVGDAVEANWFGAKADGSVDAAPQIKKAIETAIHTHTKVRLAPGTYRFDQVIALDIPDNFHLIIEGNGALIKASPLVTSASSEVNLIRFFTSAGTDTQGTGVFIDNLDFDGGVPNPQFTEPNISAIKRIHAVVAEDIFTVNISNCHFKNIQGSGTRTYNFVYANFQNLNFQNVGGKFRLENEFDSFGDGIYLCQTNLETSRPTRRQSHSAITNCHINAYNPSSYNNYASRCGICVEGFNTLKSDHRVYLQVSNCTISGYDRTFHIEGIDAEVTATALNVQNFQCIYLMAWGRSKCTFTNCNFNSRLPNNPNQVRLGTGGINTYPSELINHITFNHCQINPQGEATFIGQLDFVDSILDYSNHDVYFEHAIIVLTRSQLINISHNLSRGLNFYGCTLSATNSIMQGYKNGADNSGGILHFEDLVLPVFDRNTITDTRLILTFKPAALARLTNNIIYRHPKGSGAPMEALMNFNNIQQVQMSNNIFYVDVATASDQEPIYQTYAVQHVSHDHDIKYLHILDSGKTSKSRL